MNIFDPITLITVNYNGKKLLKPYLESVFSLDYPKQRLEVIVVDSGSADGSSEFVRKHYPKVKLIQSTLNNYCYANNLAISKANGRYIGLINNDVKLDKDWISQLLEIIEPNPQIGAVTGKILFADKRINSTGHIGLPNLYWQDRGFKEKDCGQYDKVEEIPSLSHCACLYRKEALKDAGPLDEDFNMYLEDIDMSIRLRQKGWQLYYVPKATCTHEFHRTVDKKTLIRHIEKNRLLLIAKYYPQELEKALFNKGYFSVIGKLDRKFCLTVLNTIKSKQINLRQQIELLKKRSEKFYSSKLYKVIIRPFWFIRNLGIVK